MAGLSWVKGVFLMEVRRMLAYRGGFWLGFAGIYVVQLTIGWFLWSSVYETRGQSTLGTYSLHGMILYGTLAAGIQRMLYGDTMGATATDIYNGALSRYLMYPFSYFNYRLSIFLAQIFMFAQQLAAGIIIYLVIFPFPPEMHFSLWSFISGVALALAGALVFFWLSQAIETVAFWLENVWALLVTVRMTTAMLGGTFFPLFLFPDHVQVVLEHLPFAFLVSVPARAFLGEVGGAEFLRSLTICLVWSSLFAGLSFIGFRRGLRSYTGVGI